MQKRLRVFIAVKLIAIAIVAIAHLDEGFYVGDKQAIAEEKKSPPNSQRIDAENPDLKEDDGEKGTEKVRRSFLSNLFELPTLDGDKISKEELGKYLEIAERKKRQIEERLEILKKQEQQLRGLEDTIEGKLKALTEERQYFAQTVQKEKELKGERLEKIITMYAKMEPKKAAPVVEKLDKDLVVDLFKALPQKQITAILEAMSPDKAVQISEYYGRVRSTREYDVLKEMNKSLLDEFDKCRAEPPAAPAE